MLKKIAIGSILIFFMTPCLQDTYGRVYIDIDSPSLPKFPIAITDFYCPVDREGHSIWFPDQLGKLLKLTGYFQVIDKKAFLDTGTGGIRFADWTAIGAESLVKGAVRNEGNILSSDFHLFDVTQGKSLVFKRYTGTARDKRAMVMRFASEIMLALTGEAGVFDTRIAFAGKKGKNSEIFTINFDGTDLTRLTNYRALSILPHWSPDGRRISFTSYKRGNPDLFVIEARGGPDHLLSNESGLNLCGPWSSDGRSLLVTLSRDGNEELYVFNQLNGKKYRLTNDTSIDVSPCWSPDGTKVAFVSNRSGSPQIYVMDANGYNVKRITYEGNYNTSPRWSPKGDKIVFEGMRGGNFQILTMNPEGGQLTQLTGSGRNDSPSWSPDGRYIAFVSTTGGKSRLCIMNSNGSNFRIIHSGMDKYMYPNWSPHLNF